MKKLFFILSLLLYSSVMVFAQTDKYWKIGSKAGINFNNGVGTPDLNDSTIIYPDYNNVSSVCDNQGNFLFYSNGIHILNRKNKKMPHGNDYNNGNFSTQSASGGALPMSNGIIIIPKVGDTAKFYVFYLNLDYTIDNNWYPSKLKYSIVDIDLDGGLGDVDTTHKEIPIIQNDTLEPGNVFGTRHANGHDWWLIAKKFKTNKYFKFLIDSFGVHLHDVQNIGNEYLIDTIYYGQSCISQNGDKLAYLYGTYKAAPFQYKTGRINLLNFDRCNGALSNFQALDLANNTDTLIPTGSCFSPNGQYLYVNNQITLKEMDLNAPNILNSRILIQRWDGSLTPFQSIFYNMKVGYDDRIYVTCWGSNEYTHVINNPDVWSTGCNFVQKQIWYGGANHWSRGAIPNTPNYKLGAINCNVGMEKVTMNDERLTVYPNPVNTNLKISQFENLKMLEITNIFGQVVYESTHQYLSK